MNEQQWKELSEALRDGRDSDRVEAAAKFLHENAVAEDLPRLMEMVNDKDDVVREVVAGPLGELAGPPELPKLLVALQRGIDDGYDCDSLQGALVAIVEANRTAAQQVLKGLVKSTDNVTRENAAWLLEFCETAPGA